MPTRASATSVQLVNTPPRRIPIADFRPDLGDTEHQSLIEAHNVIPTLEGYQSIRDLVRLDSVGIGISHGVHVATDLSLIHI